MLIPSEIFIPAVVSIALAIVAHFVSILMQGKSNKHDFRIKTVETLERELETVRSSLSSERQDNRLLGDSNTDLRGIRYRLEADLEREKKTNDDLKKNLEVHLSEITELKEMMFQTTAELELLKKKNQELLENLSDSA